MHGQIGRELVSGRTELVDGGAHLVELLGTDVGAVSEAKVDEAPFAQEVLFCERLALVRDEAEGPANLRPADDLILAFFACMSSSSSMT